MDAEVLADLEHHRYAVWVDERMELDRGRDSSRAHINGGDPSVGGWEMIGDPVVDGSPSFIPTIELW